MLASTSRDDTTRLWNLAMGMVRHTLNDHKTWISAVVFSPDGKLWRQLHRTAWLGSGTQRGKQRDTFDCHPHIKNGLKHAIEILANKLTGFRLF